MKLKKNLRPLALICAVSVMSMPFSSMAADSTLLPGSLAANMLLENREELLVQRYPQEASGEELPASFDLRDKGVVTPVKLQNPFGTCWGFSAIAAAETSILSEMGKTYEETGFDLSEHHLTYFARTALKDGSSQDGEGWYTTNDDIFNTGGTMFMASSVFATGTGVVDEAIIPYRGLNSKTFSLGGAVNIYYSEKDDWTIPEEYRFLQHFELEESRILPDPSVYKITVSEDSDNFDRQLNYLGYDASATELIKKELMEGKAVSVAFAADTSLPGETESDPIYLNTEDNQWAHFTYDGGTLNHAVTIVGWDDNYSASNFLDHTNDKHGDGKAHQPEGDGAWIVKNSWGAQTSEFPNNLSWGQKNEDGKSTGYFYLSYYDRSATYFETFDFNIESIETPYMVEQYDFLPTEETLAWMDDLELNMANIFTPEADGILRSVSCETKEPGTVVTYEVYLMDEDDKVPTDGELVTTQEENYPYAGYHRADLSVPQKIAKDQRFAIVVTEKFDYEGKSYYTLNTNSALSKEGLDVYNASIYVDHAGESDEDIENHLTHLYAVGIVNPGESLVYIEELGGWADLADVIPELQKNPEFSVLAFDNFPIKAYLDFQNIDDANALSIELPELNYAEPKQMVNQPVLLAYVLLALALVIALIIAIIFLIRRSIRLKKHPELRKPKKPKKPSYKVLKSSLEKAEARITQLEQENAKLHSELGDLESNETEE